MTLAELDDILRVWKARLASIAENLLDLQGSAAYRSLTGTGGLQEIAVTGLTAARVRPALGAMHTMFQQFGLLQATVDRAEALRKQLPAFFGADAKAREIQHLLFGASIQLPAVDIPLEQRTLLGGIRSAEWMTPEQLLTPMERTFAAARDVVMSVDRAWTEFADKSSRVEQEIGRLRSQRAMPSALLKPALDDVEARLATVRAHVEADPLGAEDELRLQVESQLAEISRRIEAALQLGAQLRAARVRCDELSRMHREATEILAESQVRLASGTETLVLVPTEKIQAIQDWLARLEGKHEEGAAQAVAVGLRHWNAAAEMCVQQDGKALATMRVREEQRSELRGRFDALRAKARRFGVAESGELATLGTRAEAILYTRPVDVDQAALAVAQYEKYLSGRGREAQIR